MELGRQEVRWFWKGFQLLGSWGQLYFFIAVMWLPISPPGSLPCNVKHNIYVAGCSMECAKLIHIFNDRLSSLTNTEKRKRLINYSSVIWEMDAYADTISFVTIMWIRGLVSPATLEKGFLQRQRTHCHLQKSLKPSPGTSGHTSR